MAINRDRRIILGGLATGAALGVASCASTSVAGRAPEIVETAHGRIRGRVGDGVISFWGVPYGAPTGGAARFLPPSPPEPWSGVRDCLELGYSSPQGLPASLSAAPPPGAPRSLISSGPTGPGVSEDCLVLNVWTPATDSAKRPVMVWLHGGGFSSGSGGADWYFGDNLAREEDVVVITLNHRLNVFGYLHLEHLDPRFAGSSSAGMLDIVLALKWVKENIERFGGDPDRVMIHGESGGGRKTSVMMALPAAKGLFHRAAVQSGSALTMDSVDIAAVRTSKLFNLLGIKEGDIAALQTVPMDKLQDAGRRAATSQYRPVAGSSALPHHPFHPDAPALSANVPMLIGTCRTETSLFMGTNPRILKLDDAGLLAMTAGLTSKARAGEVVAHYKSAYPKASPTELIYRISTDRGYFLDSTIQAARKAAQQGASAFYYTFNRNTPVEGGRYLAPHASDIPFVFNTLEAGANLGGVPTTQSRLLARQVSAAWAAFARTGDPNHANLPDWPTYDATTRTTMVLDEPQCRVEDDFRKAERELMLSFGSQQYGAREPTPTGA